MTDNQPPDESLEDRLGVTPPTNFTVSGIGRIVPAMGYEQRVELIRELRRRNWTDDEIRRGDHLDPDDYPEANVGQARAKAPRPPRPPAILLPSELVDESDPLGTATWHAAKVLERLDAWRTRVLNVWPESETDDPTASKLPAKLNIVERDLETALKDHLVLGPGFTARQDTTVPVPEWDPQPGRLDLGIWDSDDFLTAVIEVKHKFAGAVQESYWDLIKVLAITSSPSRPTAYLVTATSAHEWNRNHFCAQPFSDCTLNLPSQLASDAKTWHDLTKNENPRPLRIPTEIQISTIARVNLTLSNQPWQIRTVRVATGEAPASWVSPPNMFHDSQRGALSSALPRSRASNHESK